MNLEKSSKLGLATKKRKTKVIFFPFFVLGEGGHGLLPHKGIANSRKRL